MPLFRVRQKLTLEMAETHMRRMRCAWGFEFCRPFPVPGKLGFFYVHTRSVHGAACLTSSSDGRRTRRYPKHETGQDGEDRKSPCPHRGSNSRPSGPEESALSTRPRPMQKIIGTPHNDSHHTNYIVYRSKFCDYNNFLVEKYTTFIHV